MSSPSIQEYPNQNDYFPLACPLLQYYNNFYNELLIDPMQCLSFYSQLASDPALLANGHSLVLSFLQSPQNREQTLSQLLHPNAPVLPLILNVYPCEVYPQLAPQQQSSARHKLMALYIEAITKYGIDNRRFSLSLKQLLTRIHNVQGYEQWVGLYEQLISSALPHVDYHRLVVGILAEADSRIAPLSTHIFAYTLRNHSQHSLSPRHLLQILHLCIRSFSHLHGTDPDTLATLYTPYQQQIVQYVWQHVREDSYCMKYALRLLTVLYGEMDYAERAGEWNSKLLELPELGVGVAGEYLGVLLRLQYQPEQAEEQDQQQQGQQQSVKSLQQQQHMTNIRLIYHQLFQIYDIALTSQDLPQLPFNLEAIYLTGIIACVPAASTLQHWLTHTDEYLVEWEDESSRTLRNRAVTFMLDLLESEQYRQGAKQMLAAYCAVVAQAAGQGRASGVVGWMEMRGVNASNCAAVTLEAYEEGAYYMLSSLTTELFTQGELALLLRYLMGRAEGAGSQLVRIAATLLAVNEMKPSSGMFGEMAQFVLRAIDSQCSAGNNEGSVNFNTNNKGNSTLSIGLGLALGRGLAKISHSQPQLLTQHSPAPIISLLHTLTLSLHQSLKPDEDGTHIILQLLLKLSQLSPQYHLHISALITPQFQSHMLRTYMHDGLLSSIVIEILEAYPYEGVMAEVMGVVMAGAMQDERYAEIVGRWHRAGKLRLEHEHVRVLLGAYQRERRDMVAGLVKGYLQGLPEGAQVPAAVVAMLNQQPDQRWLVLMLQKGLLQDPAAMLSRCLQTITHSVTSQYELQSKLILPFYLGIHDTQHLLTALHTSQLHAQFLQKVHRYGRLFQGEHLRVINSLFWLRLAEVELGLRGKAVELVQGYGAMETDEWEEEGEEEEEGDIVGRLLGGKMENREMEDELKAVFGELAWNGALVAQQLALIKK